MRVLFVLLSLSISIGLNAQDRQDIVQSNNFFEIQRKFNNYCKGKNPKQVSGYKQYKRWETYWSGRVMPDGSFPPAKMREEKYSEYLNNFKANRSSMMNTVTWASEGPSSSSNNEYGVGRLHCLAIDPTNENIIYVGSGGGGLWKTTTGGSSWIQMANQYGLGVSAILVHPTNPQIVYIATGSDHTEAFGYSSGIKKSTNGGMTWNSTALDFENVDKAIVSKMLFNPLNPDSIFVASNNGLYLLKNNGASSELLMSGNFFDIEANPNVSSKILYTCTQNTLFKSINSGINWFVTTYLADSYRMELAVTNIESDYLYLSACKEDNSLLGFYLSQNNGENFMLKTTYNLFSHFTNTSCSLTPGGYGRIANALTVNPSNKNHVFIGCVNTLKSTNSGENWSIISKYTPEINCGNASVVHADKHDFQWFGNTLYEVNDGGIYKTTDFGNTWINISNGIDNAHINKIDVAQTDNKILSAHIDNGTKLKANTWNEVLFGDGTISMINYLNSSTIYAGTYNGKIEISYDSGINWADIHTNKFPNDAANFIAPTAMDPINPSIIYIGYKKLYKSTDEGNNWTSIFNLSDKSLSIIKVAPSDPNCIYISDSTRIWRTLNGGSSWSLINSQFNKISSIEISPTNHFHIYLTRQSYTPNDQVYKSTNGGLSWDPYSLGLPNIPANTIKYQNNSNELMYLGMDVGIYYWDIISNEWAPYGMNLPNVAITDLKINYSTSSLYAGTFGRGVWSAPVFYCYQSPDLVINNQTVGPYFVAQGQNMIVSFNDENIGNTDASPHLVKFYLSEDAVLTSSDIYLGQYIIASTIPAQTFHNATNVALTIPLTTQTGNYYLYYVVDSELQVSECIEDNNFASTLVIVQQNINTNNPYYRHWIDNDITSVQAFNITPINNIYDINKNISLSYIPNGLHTINFQLKDNLWSSISSSFFYKTSYTSPAGSPRYQYWFDNNFTGNYTHSITTTNNLILLSNISTSPVNYGLHTFNIRFKPEGNHWSSVNSSFFYKPRTLPIGTPSYEYWLDNEYASKVSINHAASSDFIFLNSLNMNSINDGLHTFNIRFRPEGKLWSSINSSFFYKPRIIPQGTPQYQYWIDNNFDLSNMTIISSTDNFVILENFDLSTISDGLHTFNIRFRPEGKLWSSIISSFFYKPRIIPQGNPEYQFWIDNNFALATTTTIPSTDHFILMNDTDLSSITDGLHTFNIRFRPDGKLYSSISSNFFYKKPQVILGQPKYQYWFDNNLADSVTVNHTSTNDLILLSDLTTNILTEGLHTFNIRFKPDGGHWSSVNTSFFVKGHEQATEITKCLYWFDDNFVNPNTVQYSGSDNVHDLILANTTGLAAGEHTLSMFFMDNTGNWSSIVKDTFVKDTIIPLQCPMNQEFVSGVGNPYNLGYQWQVDTGSGFEDISNNSNYSGATTDTLVISNPIYTWYNNKYRCRVTLPNNSISYGPEYSLKFIYIWNGSIDDNWHNPSNWDCNGTPIQNSDVFINAGSVNVGSNVDIGSITTSQNVALDLITNKQLLIKRY